MKKARFLFGMILWAMLTHGTGWARQQEQPALRGEEKSLYHSSPDGSQDTETHGPKEQTDKYSDENQERLAAHKEGTRQRRPASGYAKPAPSRQLRSAKTPAANDLRTEMPRDVVDAHQTNSTGSFAVPNKPLRHPSTSVPPPTVGLNGRQFKNSRDLGGRMASSGGPATSTKSTAGLNGTNLRPKP